MATTDLEAAIEAVLKRAILNKDEELIEAYQHVFQGRKLETKKIDGSLRLGLLIGDELYAKQSSALCTGIDERQKAGRG